MWHSGSNGLLNWPTQHYDGDDYVQVQMVNHLTSMGRLHPSVGQDLRAGVMTSDEFDAVMSAAQNGGRQRGAPVFSGPEVAWAHPGAAWMSRPGNNPAPRPTITRADVARGDYSRADASWRNY